MKDNLNQTCIMVGDRLKSIKVNMLKVFENGEYAKIKRARFFMKVFLKKINFMELDHLMFGRRT
jgi:hypothetical protein